MISFGKTHSYDGFDTLLLPVLEKTRLPFPGEGGTFQSLFTRLFPEGLPAGEAVGLRLTSEGPVEKLVFVSLCDAPTPARVEKAYATAAGETEKVGAKNALLLLPEALSPALSAKAYETVLLASYRFTRYRKSEKELPTYSVHTETDCTALLQEAALLAKVTCHARDLVNEPANVLYPETLADAAVAAGKSAGFSVKVLEPTAIAALKMEAFLAVGQGSVKTPRLISMRYMGAPESGEILGLIGKGITYDSGGYCIKSGDGMATMKSDMGGAAAVISAMEAIAQEKLSINVVAVVAACSNMISGDAYRAGDVIGSMAGKTIEVINTDAEGRLTLVDAITYAIQVEKVTRLVDIATLTGAAVVALGDEITAVLASCDTLYSHLEAASVASCEKIWRLPCDESLGSRLKSHIADYKNVAGREAGTIVAGMFIKNFTEELPWAHLDIAGPSYVKKDTPLCPTGGTGCGTRILYALAKELANK